MEALEKLALAISSDNEKFMIQESNMESYPSSAFGGIRNMLSQTCKDPFTSSVGCQF
jgi:hypothetical protein